MAIKAGVGRSLEPDAAEAGAQAAKTAMEQIGTEAAGLVIVAATLGYDHAALLAGVRSVTQDVPLVGCTTAGVIDNEGADESLRRVEVMVIASDKITFTPVVAQGVHEDAEKVGNDLAGQLNKVWPTDPKFLMILIDGLTVDSPDRMFHSLESTLPVKLPFVGGGASETSAWRNTYQYFNDQVLQNAVIAVLFSGDFTFDIGVSHGSRPVGITKEITKAEGNHIFEIDHKPAFAVFQEFLGPDVTELTHATVTGVSLGIETPLEARKDYEDVTLQIPLSLDKTDNSIYINRVWPVGTKLLICRRDADTIIRRAKEIADKINTRNHNKQPAFVLHFDCAGRSKEMIGADTAAKEVAANQVFDKQVPWFGFYTFGEIAPIQDKNFLHGWTSVVVAIY